MGVKEYVKKHPSVIGIVIALFLLIFIAVTIIQQHSP